MMRSEAMKVIDDFYEAGLGTVRSQRALRGGGWAEAAGRRSVMIGIRALVF